LADGKGRDLEREGRVVQDFHHHVALSLRITSGVSVCLSIEINDPFILRCALL
jgi:hypothetical protein